MVQSIIILQNQVNIVKYKTIKLLIKGFVFKLFVKRLESSGPRSPGFSFRYLFEPSIQKLPSIEPFIWCLRDQKKFEFNILSYKNRDHMP